MESLVTDSIAKFIAVNAEHMVRNVGCERAEAIAAGELAFFQCVRDGEAHADGRLSVGAKRFIRREMLRASSPAYLPKYNSLIDYGYEDGRNLKRGARVQPKNKWQRHRHKLIALGLCRICGKQPEEGRTLCSTCWQKRKLIAYRRAERRRMVRNPKSHLSPENVGLLIELRGELNELSDEAKTTRGDIRRLLQTVR
jgi:hypothetical protein